MSQLLFYDEARPVSPTDHRDLCIKAGDDYGFTKSANMVPLMATEFLPAASEYTIVFGGDDDAIVPVVILGAERDQNLYLNEDHTWRARYVPAFVRRYPFVFAQAPDTSDLVLCVDEGFSGCNRDGRGERLFDADGERTAYLEQVLTFMRAFQAQHQRTQAFCRKLVELELLQPVQARLNPASGQSRALGGLRIVNRDKLRGLDAETLHALHASEELELVYLQLHSLVNLRVIGERLPGPASAPTAPEPDEPHAGGNGAVTH